MNPEHFHRSASTLRVCVEGAQEGRISGQLYSSQISAPLTFFDFGRLLLYLDALMDLQNYPQSFQRKRVFRGCRSVSLPKALTESPLLSPPQVLAARGGLTTFDLQIRSRQNATWQGYFLPPQTDADAPVPFQSALELLHLVASHVFSQR